MKSLILLCATIAVVSAVNQELYELPQQKLLAIIYKFAQPCSEKNNLDAHVLVPQIADASLTRDGGAIDEFLYCFAYSAGYVEADGQINVDRLAGILPSDHPRMEDMKEALRKCNEITKENPIKTTIAMNDCIAHTAPVRFVFNA